MVKRWRFSVAPILIAILLSVPNVVAESEVKFSLVKQIDEVSCTGIATTSDAENLHSLNNLKFSSMSVLVASQDQFVEDEVTETEESWTVECSITESSIRFFSYDGISPDELRKVSLLLREEGQDAPSIVDTCTYDDWENGCYVDPDAGEFSPTTESGTYNWDTEEGQKPPSTMDVCFGNAWEIRNEAVDDPTGPDEVSQSVEDMDGICYEDASVEWDKDIQP